MPIPDKKSREPKPPKQAGEPSVALLLTWLVPGGGHLYLGKTGFALAAFLVVEGLYALGLMFSDGMFLEYLPGEMRSRFAAALTPEVGNLGALLYHVKEYGYGEPEPRRWPAGMDVGTALTAMSGILNLFVMARAHLDARLPERPRDRVIDPATASLATWLVPGLGQFLQGRRLRGAIVFVLLVGLFLIGCSLAGGSNLDRERHFYYWAGQTLLGLPAFVAEFVHGHVRMAADVEYADAGVVLGCVAGMLNVLVMLDAFTYSEERILGKPVPPKGEGEPSQEEAMEEASA